MAEPQKMIAIGELFTDEELKLAEQIIRNNPATPGKELHDRITSKVIDRINKKTGQLNGARYWAYALEYAVGAAINREST